MNTIEAIAYLKSHFEKSLAEEMEFLGEQR